MRNPLVFSLFCLFLLAFGQRAAAQCSPDTEPPTAACIVPMDFLLSSNQTGSLLAGALSDGSSDNCATNLSFYIHDGLPTTLPTASSLNFDADDIGTHDVTLWVVDEAGNLSHCTTQIHVKDECTGGNNNPTVNCVDNLSVEIDAGDTLVVHPGFFLEGTGYCSNYELRTIAPFGLIETGNYFSLDTSDAGTITFQVVNTITGNNCYSELEVVANIPCPNDNVPPFANCFVLSQYVNVANGDVTITADQVGQGSDDCPGSVSLWLTETPNLPTPPTTNSITFGTDDLGANQVILWVVDAAGNASICNSFIIVDTCEIPQVITCKDTVNLYVNANGTPTELYPLDVLDGGDFCPDQLGIKVIGINFTFDPYALLDASHVGQHTVQVVHQISDVGCQSVLNVVEFDCSNDVLAPEITAPADHVYSSVDFEQFVFDLNDNASMDAVFGAATAFDLCGTTTILQSNAVVYDQCDRINQITRSFIALDGAGNSSATATQVIDVQFKYLIYLPADHYPNDPGVPAELTYINLDTTNLLVLSQQDVAYDVNNDGITDRIDRTWNLANLCLADLQQPFIELPRLDINNDGIVGDAFAAKTFLDSVEYYGASEIGYVPNTGALTYLQKIYLTDVPCTLDTVPPVAICVENTVAQFAVSGPNLTVIHAQAFDNASYDDCSDLSFAVEMAATPSTSMPTSTTVSFTAVGIYPNVYLWVADESGNAQHCIATVEIVPPKCTPDETEPAFVFVPADTVIHSDDLAAINLDPQNLQQLNQYFGEAQAWDYCGLDTVLQSVQFLANSCGSPQTITRSFAAIDLAGNMTLASQTISVIVDFSLNLPADYLPGNAGQPQELTVVSSNSAQFAFTYADVVLAADCNDQPELIQRYWTVVNLCAIPQNANPLQLPRLDLNNDGQIGDAYTAWENEGNVYRLENGLPVELLTAANSTYGYIQSIRYNYNDTIQYEVKGKVFQDDNASCSFDAGEPNLANWPVKAVGNNSGHTYLTTADANGNYLFSNICVEDTELEVSLDVPLNYGQTCPTTWAVTLIEGGIAEQNIPVQLDTTCEIMEVSLATPYLRRCFANNYTVSYCNYSAATIEDTWVEVDLDTFMRYNSSSIPGTLISGNTYSFATGDLAAGQCSNFIINFDLNCEAELGQTHCTEARIYPDTLCPQNANWTGANIEVEGRCINDEVLLSIKNTGSGDMAGPLEYIVVEEVLMFSTGSFNLGAGQTMQLPPIPANGATWRLEAEQSPQHPYPGSVAVALEGCEGINELGLVNLFPLENPNPFITVDCQENIGAFDPNDKQAQPKGYGEEHFINRNTDIEYTIRFQNTGTDTAFNVVILDQLSEHLDPTSIRPGASSHAYSFERIGGDSLRFTFSNIMLPDSNVNLAASQGFVQFVAKQMPDLALGSVIANEAAIYFDFNDPITTNRVFHTIGEDFIQVLNSASETANVHGQPTVYPNPAFGAVTFALPLELKDASYFTLHDQLGKLVHRQAVSGDKFVFERKGMAPGIYFYSIENEGLKIFAGKVVLK